MALQHSLFPVYTTPFPERASKKLHRVKLYHPAATAALARLNISSTKLPRVLPSYSPAPTRLPSPSPSFLPSPTPWLLSLGSIQHCAKLKRTLLPSAPVLLDLSPFCIRTTHWPAGTRVRVAREVNSIQRQLRKGISSCIGRRESIFFSFLFSLPFFSSCFSFSFVRFGVLQKFSPVSQQYTFNPSRSKILLR